jgi:hypothetical protein
MNCLVEPEPTEAELQLFHRIYRAAARLLAKDGGLQPVAFFRAGPNEEGMFCKSCPFQGACKTWHREKSKLVSTPVKAVV